MTGGERGSSRLIPRCSGQTWVQYTARWRLAIGIKAVINWPQLLPCASYVELGRGKCQTTIPGQVPQYSMHGPITDHRTISRHQYRFQCVDCSRPFDIDVVLDLPRLSAFAPYFIPVQRNFPTEALIFFIKHRRRAIAVGLSDIACRFA